MIYKFMMQLIIRLFLANAQISHVFPIFAIASFNPWVWRWMWGAAKLAHEEMMHHTAGEPEAALNLLETTA